MRQLVFVHVYAHTNTNILMDIDIHTNSVCEYLSLCEFIDASACMSITKTNTKSNKKIHIEIDLHTQMDIHIDAS